MVVDLVQFLGGSRRAAAVGGQLGRTGLGLIDAFVKIENDSLVSGAQAMIPVYVFIQISQRIDQQGMDLADPVHRTAGGQIHAGPENRLVGGPFTTPGG